MKEEKGERDAQGEEEDERVVVVVPGRGDDRGGHERADERGRLADDREEREEEEPAFGGARLGSVSRARRGRGSGIEESVKIACVHLGQWGDFADHRLTVRVPWANHQSIISLVKPNIQKEFYQ